MNTENKTYTTRELKDNPDLISKILHVPYPKLLWGSGYYDGVLSGVCEKWQKRYWFELITEEYLKTKYDCEGHEDHTSIRVFAVVDLTSEQWKIEDEQHADFRKYVGTHTDYNDGKRDHSQICDQKHWKKYYDKWNKIEVPTKKDNPVVAWFCEENFSYEKLIEETCYGKTAKRRKIEKLKDKCKEFAKAGVEQRKLINASSGLERHKAWEKKREIGQEARLHYIAYGLLRGKDYHTIEPKIRNDGSEWWTVPLRAKRVAKVLQEYSIEVERDKWTEKYVEELIQPKRDQV